jgi:hypothetical protein
MASTLVEQSLAHAYHSPSRLAEAVRQRKHNEQRTHSALLEQIPEAAKAIPDKGS